MCICLRSGRNGGKVCRKDDRKSDAGRAEKGPGASSDILATNSLRRSSNQITKGIKRMFPPPSDSKALLDNLSESYSVEVKSWFDPKSHEGKSKLVKAMLALRNNNGGRLVIGFDDATMAPALDSRPEDMRAAFGQDMVQALAAKFSSESFEVLVQYVKKDDFEYPVICVPSGIKTPVAAKAEIRDDTEARRALVQINTVYVRTLKSNNTVSTAAAGWQDWGRIAEICFDNREADIGRFMRRHLDEVTLARVAAVFGSATTGPGNNAKTLSSEWLEKGRKAFDARLHRDGITLPDIGFLEIAAVIDGDVKDELETNRSMKNLITTANRRFTGWPFFVTLDGADVPERRPQAIDDGWEQAVIVLAGDPWGMNGLDFWRVEPNGRLYAIRALDEDISEDLAGTRQLAITLAIWRVGDALLEALAIGKAMAKEPESASLAVTIRWTGLAGRRLTNARSRRYLVVGGQSQDDAAMSYLSIPLDIPDAALIARIAGALAPLYRRFDGFEISGSVVEQEMQELMSRTF